MKTKDRKNRITVKWQRDENRFIEELDKRLGYNWRGNCGEAEQFYKDMESDLHLQSIKEKKRSKTLVFKA